MSTGLVCRRSLQVGLSILAVFCTSGLAQNPLEQKTDKTEQAALSILNDSDWARSVKPSLQDKSCSYQNPAFPGLYPENRVASVDSVAAEQVPGHITADDSQYLIRFQSAKPVQEAVQQLLTMGDKWSAYGLGDRRVSQDEAPTDLANGRYNVADMITVAVILKKPGPDGTNLFEYGYEENGHKFPSRGFVFPCAGLRTANGQVFAHVVPDAFGRDGKTKALQLSFPRLVNGKPLISGVREKVEFRLIVKQRVFQATFFVSASDVLDGSEQILFLPSTFTNSEEMARE